MPVDEAGLSLDEVDPCCAAVDDVEPAGWVDWLVPACVVPLFVVGMMLMYLTDRRDGALVTLGRTDICRAASGGDLLCISCTEPVQLDCAER